MSSKGELHLAIEGQNGGGIKITSTTSLAYVRTHFPVPAGYIFGVPTDLEPKLKAKEFLPLMLLRADDCLQGKLGATSAPADFKAENDRLEYEAAQFRLRVKELTASYAQREAQHERELAELRARASAAETAEAQLSALREQQRALEGEAKLQRSALEDELNELKLATQSESRRLVAQLSDAQAEAARSTQAAASAAGEVLVLRGRLAAAVSGAADADAKRDALRAQCAALGRAASAAQSALVGVRADTIAHRAELEGAMARCGRAVHDAVAFARQGEARSVAAAESAAARAEAARAETVLARAEAQRLDAACERALAECERARSERDEARAELKRAKAEAKAERAKLSTDAAKDMKRKESAVSSEGAKFATELAAAQAELAERTKELKRARAEASSLKQAGAERERALLDDASSATARQNETAARLAHSQSLVTDLERALVDARSAQGEVEAAWGEAGSRRPVSFSEFVELRREVQQLALSGREFYVSPTSLRQQQEFLTRLARVETMLAGAREGSAATRAAAALPATNALGARPRVTSVASDAPLSSALPSDAGARLVGAPSSAASAAPQVGVLSRTPSGSVLQPTAALERVISRAMSQAGLPGPSSGAPDNQRLGQGQRRNSAGFAGAGAGSHLHLMQGLRAKREANARRSGAAR